MNLTEAATSIGVSGRTLRLAVERREIEAEHPLADGPWVINQRALKTDAAVRLLSVSKQPRPRNTNIATEWFRIFNYIARWAV
jgi:hypothetical protein